MATQGWYNVVDKSTGEILGSKRRSKDIETDDEFFENLMKDQSFKLFVENKYKLTNVNGENDDREDDTIESDTE